jgi:hypothetical protein
MKAHGVDKPTITTKTVLTITVEVLQVRTSHKWRSLDLNEVQEEVFVGHPKATIFLCRLIIKCLHRIFIPSVA